MARSLCSIFQILYFRATGGEENEEAASHLASNLKIVDKLYSFAYVWSVGGSLGGLDDHERFDDFCGDVLDFGINFGRDGVFGSFVGKYSKRRRSNVAVIIVRILFIGSFLFYCVFF